MSPTKSKKTALMLLVNAHLLIVGPSRSNDALRSADAAVSRLAEILTLDEEQIPQDVGAACLELMRFVHGQHDENNNPYPRPSWFNPGVYEWAKPAKIDNE